MLKYLENIKDIRRKLKLSQDYVAHQIGIETANYSRLESGKSQLTVERLYKIAEILGVSVMTLLDEPVPAPDYRLCPKCKKNESLISILVEDLHNCREEKNKKNNVEELKAVQS